MGSGQRRRPKSGPMPTVMSIGRGRLTRSIWGTPSPTMSDEVGAEGLRGTSSCAVIPVQKRVAICYVQTVDRQPACVPSPFSPLRPMTHGQLADAQGHSNCVGCQTALRSSMLPPVPETQAIQRYLKPLTQLARAMTTEDGPPSLDLLVEENVAQQVRNLLASQVVQDDWKRRGQYGVTVHGWVYQLENVSVPPQLLSIWCSHVQGHCLALCPSRTKV